MFGDFTKDIFRVSKSTIAISLLVSLTPWVVLAQEKTDESSAELSHRVTELSALVQKLLARVDELEETIKNRYSILIVSLRLPYALTPTMSAGTMQGRGELRIDPGQLGTNALSGELNTV